MKKKIHQILVTCAVFCAVQSPFLNAQTVSPCGTDEVMQKLYAQHPELFQQQIDYDNTSKQQIDANRGVKSTDPLLTIPVVFHIIHTYGSENISDAQIFNEMVNLNTNYAKQNLADLALIVGNSPFDTLASEIKIQFRLATIDPNGNCTNGIDRIYSHLGLLGSDESKLNQWPRDKYLNIWTVASSSSGAAYAYYPSATSGFLSSVDGVLTTASYVGGTCTGCSGSMLTSKTITHEIGHFLNLKHVWGDSNNPQVSCGDDNVDDTPITQGHLQGGYGCDRTPHCTKSFKHQWVFGFDNILPTSGQSDPTPVETDTMVTASHFSAHNVSANPIDSSRFSFRGMAIGAINGDTTYANMLPIDTSRYYQVTIYPNWAYTMSFMGINFNVKRNGSGIRTFAVRSSSNNYSSNLPASKGSAADSLISIHSNEFFFNKDTAVSQNAHVTLYKSNPPVSGTAYKNLLTPLTFRFYGWNAEDSLGSFSIDNVTFLDTAGVIENFDNYMDYSYCSPNGQRMFTRGQKDRMRVAVASPVSYRSSLWLNSNLVATGTADPYPSGIICVPKADFYSDGQNICQGGSITFHSFVTNTTQGNTPVLKWSFPGTNASGATLTSANPTVIYPTAGDYAVQLKVSNSAGADSVIKTTYIHVGTGWAQYVGNAVENFENNSSYYWNWQIDNPDNNSHGFGIINFAGYSGTHSMVMNALGNYKGDVDDFITPSFNLFNLTGGSLTFRCASASRALTVADMTEILKIYSSTNCGQTWQLRTTFSGANLNNNGYDSDPFVPNSQSQWALKSVNIPASLSQGNVRFKFEYTSGSESNNLFIDDININGTVGIDENNLDNASVSIYPNPSNETTTIYYHLNKKENIKIEMFDLVGKRIMEIDNGNQAEGDYSYPVSKEEHNLNNGIYFVKFSVDGNSITKKIIFTK